jgi:hypothetical protein
MEATYRLQVTGVFDRVDAMRATSTLWPEEPFHGSGFATDGLPEGLGRAVGSPLVHSCRLGTSQMRRSDATSDRRRADRTPLHETLRQPLRASLLKGGTHLPAMCEQVC